LFDLDPASRDFTSRGEVHVVSRKELLREKYGFNVAIHGPVVPHKAVAEVSKIGNL